MNQLLSKESSPGFSPNTVHMIVFSIFLVQAMTYISLGYLNNYFLLLIYGVLPVCLFKSWITKKRTEGWSTFIFIKIYSVTSYSSIFLLIKEDLFFKTDFAGYLIFGFMILNILEAVIAEAFQPSGKSKINILSGFFLALSTPFSSDVTIVGDHVFYACSYSWLVAYTCWNFSFVYRNWVGAAGFHLANLVVALGLSFYFGSDAWIEIRVFTLASFFIFYASGPFSFRKFVATDFWYHKKVHNLLPYLSLVSIGFHIATKYLLD